MPRPVLPSGGACVECRKLKAKCDGLKPACSRCQRLEKQCRYSDRTLVPARFPRTQLLQARVLELELAVTKLTLPSTCSLSIISARLRERIGHLGTSRERVLPNLTALPIYICSENSKRDVLLSNPSAGGETSAIHQREEPTYKVNTHDVKRTLESFEWVEGEELPLEMSLYLIGLLLPYRSHFQFFIPIPYLLRGLSLPSSDPASIHPCLRNACHLAACSVIGGHWSSLEPYFATRTRRFLEEALMLPTRDHVIHFLWASTLLASYLSRARRVEESFAIITPACYLSTAFGLLDAHNPEPQNDSQCGEALLPPPATEAEALHRIWLSHSLFLTDWSLSALSGLPCSLDAHERWTPSFDTGELVYPAFQSSTTSDEELSKIWRSDIHRNMWSMYLFQGVAAVAQSSRASQAKGDQLNPTSLKGFIQFHNSKNPQLFDAINHSNPDILFSHAALYGSLLVIYSLEAGNDAQARCEMLRCAQRLARICTELRGHKHLRMIQSSLVPMVHMMNAIRILAHELRRSDVRGNTSVSIEYCRCIEVLLDFLDSTTALYPAWYDSPRLLEGTLIKALEPL